MGTSLLPQLDLFADPVRARLLLLLEPREMSVGDLSEVVQLPQPTVSRHLKALNEAGWVTLRADGTSRLYRTHGKGQGGSLSQLWELVRQEIGGTTEARRDAERVRHVVARREARDLGFFNGSAAQWDDVRSELFGGRAELLPLLGLLEPTWVVGDLGTGTGHLALAAAPFVGRVIAVDGSSAMLEVARARLAGVANVELRKGHLEELPLDEASLDLALLSLVLTYAGDPGQVIAEAARVLKPGGRLLLVDLQQHDQVELRQRFGQQWPGFSGAEVKEWIRKAGLRDVRVVSLPPEAQARGPLLFAAAARKDGHTSRSTS
jgi:ArsR family transcriptional regulator